MSSSTSLRLVPAGSSSHHSSVTKTSHSVHAGVHDVMRLGPRSLAHEAESSSAHHPMQQRLEKWNETRDNLKLTMQRNVFGIGAPMRTMLERGAIVKDGPFPNLHAGHAGRNMSIAQLQLDILNGDDETLEPVDFLPTETALEQPDIHALMDIKKIA